MDIRPDGYWIWYNPAEYWIHESPDIRQTKNDQSLGHGKVEGGIIEIHKGPVNSTEQKIRLE